MKKILLILIVIFTGILMFSCNQLRDCSDTDYSDCNTVETKFSNLKVRITINSENQIIPIKIYFGNIEDNKLFKSFDTTISEFQYLLPTNERFTLAAQYISGDDTIVAIDEGYMKTKSQITCDSICWTLKEDDADLRLKY